MHTSTGARIVNEGFKITTRRALKGRSVPEQEEAVFGAGQRHIQPPVVTQKADLQCAEPLRPLV